MKFFPLVFLAGSVVCLQAQTPPPASTQPNKTPVPQPHVELSIENPADKKMAEVPPDRVVLSVGDVKVTAAQFDQFVSYLPDNLRAAAHGGARKQFADNLARMYVLAEEARKRKIEQTPDFDFQKQNILASLMYQQLSKDAKIDDADLRKYYADHKAEFEQVMARHILIRMQGSPLPVKPGQKDLTPEEALAKANELEKRIKAGEDFAKIAIEESDDTGSAAKGGDLGWFRHGTMVPSFDQAAFALKPGEVSEPVKSQFGYHVIKVEGAKGFDDVKADVEKRMVPDVVQKKLEEMQKNTLISYDPEFFSMTKQ